MNNDKTLTFQKYQNLECIHQGQKSLVYRTQRISDHQPVILKLLRSEYPSFNELVQFRHQYTITQNLNIPGIIQPLALENYRNSLILVMADEGYISLDEYTQNNSLSLSQCLTIGITLAEILAGLYYHRIIHKDIKPANILIHPETQQIQLIDFSIASLLPKETQDLKNPNILEGTLAYISPEQTGRMNRGIDYRTDFYSFGVTLYELLSGKLPFEATDAMELVHCHIAKMPSVLGNNEEIPEVVSNIVFKLMAKNAEDRYQSAWGIQKDLEICLNQLENTEKVELFEIATQDICNHFIIPEKLYGRQQPVQQLLDAFVRVAFPQEKRVASKPDKTRSEMMLVAGYSGVGKTAVVNEVHKPIVRQRGYFIKGKFDQFQRNIPFSAFVQALRDLMGQLLSENDAQLQQWKQKILAAVGDNGQVIIEVIPELEKIIGQQPPVTELSGSAAQNRFNLLFQKFLQVLTTKEHPLVIFLDDLQWADSASLNLLKLLMSEAESQYLFLIGAYRDNEVSPAHPLMLTLDEIKKQDAVVNTITLAPLRQHDLNQLVADTLHCSLPQALPLTQAVYQKTKGNPFFATQFLKALHEDGGIHFNPEEGFWQCDLAQVKLAAVSEDVVEFVSKRLQKFNPLTQDTLKLAACIGNEFDLETLAIVRQTSEVETATDLWQALKEGLILPTTEVYKFYTDKTQEIHLNQNGNHISVSYKFLHDRIQQAAYSLIPEEHKKATHLKIGQLLLKNIPESEQEERIFEIVNQLNYGVELITKQKEKDELAELNLIACRKARSATAYQAGREYASIGLSLLGEKAWLRQYEMSLNFHELAAELASLCGDFDQMDKLIEIVIAQAQSLLEQVDVYRIIIQANASQNKLTEAITIAQQFLQKLGMILPEEPTQNDVQQSILDIEKLIGNREIEDFVDLPLMTDAEKIAIVQTASSIIPVTHMSGSPLFPLVVALSVKLSIQYGNTSASILAYACYAIIVCNMQQDVNIGVKFGQLALQVVSKMDAKAVKPAALVVAGLFVLHRQSHIKETLPLLQESYISALEVGNYEFAGYSIEDFCLNSFWCGQPLANLEQETRVYCNALVQLNQVVIANRCRISIFWQSILNLLGIGENPTILSGEVLDEAEFIPHILSTRNVLGLYYFYLYKLMLFYLFEEVQSAQSYAVKVKQYLVAGASTVGEPAFYFYDSLTILAALNLKLSDSSEILQKVEKNQIILQQQWATHAPMNYQHKYDLVEAEKCRVLGQKLEAMELYDKAIAGAKENEYIQEEALANELAAKFYLELGREKVAQTYMIEAYYCYSHWGAKAKVDQLEQQYPDLLTPILQQEKVNINRFQTCTETRSQGSHTSASSISISNLLDLTSVIKASQALSGEIELEKLFTKLMQVILENAGATKGALILNRDQQLTVEVITTQSPDLNGNLSFILQGLPLAESSEVPHKFINRVKRQLEPLVIDNVLNQPEWAADEYLLTQQPISLLGLPISNQGKLLAILYLENCLMTQAFTDDRVEVLKLLCSQAAISLENAQLFRKQQQTEAELQRRNVFLKAQQESSLDGILVVDTNRHVSAYNQRFVSIWNIPEAILATKDDQQLLGFVLDQLEDPAEFLAKVEYLYDHPEENSRDEVILKDQRCLERYSSPVRLASGDYDSRIWYFRDISERKRAEAAVIQKSQELEQSLVQLQAAQVQLVQSEKMSALGEMMSGIAHEINNPVGFIGGNLSPAEDYVQDLIEHLKLYQEKFPEPGEEIEDNAKEIELDYVLEDLPQLISSMKTGVNRIKEISTSMRIFARSDRDQKVTFDVHQGIDSTLLILKHRLKANEKRPEIKILKDYGDFSQFLGFPGQLNQVFMNIIANAIDVFDENSQKDLDPSVNSPRIRIQTTKNLSNQMIEIRIEDNGGGMSEAVKNKIFDHLFTTKAVGKGTGLGLAISRQIVEEKHGGKLSCHSQIGQGTEFLIEIPDLTQ
ncbi:MAG: AAA family ATPase [Cyanobacteria bacterium J06592_8]